MLKPWKARVPRAPFFRPTGPAMAAVVVMMVVVVVVVTTSTVPGGLVLVGGWRSVRSGDGNWEGKSGQGVGRSTTSCAGCHASFSACV